MTQAERCSVHAYILQHTLRASTFANYVSATALSAAVPSARGAVMPIILSGAPFMRARAHAMALSIITNHGIHGLVKVLHNAN